MAATEEARLARVLDRIAIGTSVYRTRVSDNERSVRNGNGKDEGLNKAIEKLETAANALWDAIK